MALEAQAAMTTGLILASRFDQRSNELGIAWRRLMTPAAKFWICKRAVEVSGAHETRLRPLVTWLTNAVKPIAQHGTAAIEIDARLLTQKLVILAQACLLIEHANPHIAEAFIATRTDPDWGAVVGVSSAMSAADAQKILALSWRA